MGIKEIGWHEKITNNASVELQWRFEWTAFRHSTWKFNVFLQKPFSYPIEFSHSSQSVAQKRQREMRRRNSKTNCAKQHGKLFARRKIRQLVAKIITVSISCFQHKSLQYFHMNIFQSVRTMHFSKIPLRSTGFDVGLKRNASRCLMFYK